MSNVAFTSKYFKKVVSARSTDYLNNNNLMDCLQSSYRARYSAETALIKVPNDVLEAFDNGSAVALIMLSLSAAFDNIDHTILLSHLIELFGAKHCLGLILMCLIEKGVRFRCTT